MQQIIIEKPYQFTPPFRGTFWSKVLHFIGLPGIYLRRYEAVTEYEVRGPKNLEAARKAGPRNPVAPKPPPPARPPLNARFAGKICLGRYGMASWHLFQKR